MAKTRAKRLKPEAVVKTIAGKHRLTAEWWSKDGWRFFTTMPGLAARFDGARDVVPAIAEFIRRATDAPDPAALPPGFAPLATHEERLTVRAGDEVAVRQDDGALKTFEVSHVPYDSFGQFVLSLSGVAGCYLLSRVVGVKRATEPKGGEE